MYIVGFYHYSHLGFPEQLGEVQIRGTNVLECTRNNMSILFIWYFSLLLLLCSWALMLMWLCSISILSLPCSSPNNTSMVNGPPPASAGSSSSQASTERSNRQSYYSPTAWQSTQPSAGGSNTYETIYAPNVPYSGYQSTAFHQPPQPTASDDSTHNWDKIFRSFLAEVGLTQTLQGFESDMLVLNDKWERKKVPLALRTLVNELSVR